MPNTLVGDNMKKVIISLFVVMVVLLVSSNNTKTVIIPEDAIRFRIIANSNSLEDQKNKFEIKKDLEPIIGSILTKSENINETRNNLSSNMFQIKKEIENHTTDYKINYGYNYFPEKTYKGVTYKEGSYESLVVTLGDGLGDNWWCVLFPPLCLLEASEEKLDDNTYSFYIKEVIDKYF